MKRAVSSISIEHIKKATDKRGGLIVNFQRSTMRGRQASTVWKELRFLNGRFEKWPGRWEIDQLDVFVATVIKVSEEFHETLSRGETLYLQEKLDLTQRGGLKDYLLRNINDLDRRTS